MNNQSSNDFPTLDQALSVLLVGGLTLASAVLVAAQGVQVFVA